MSVRRCGVLVGSGGMPSCPHCQQTIVTRDGHDRQRRQRFTCSGCGRDFTIRSASAFSGYRWPADVILMAVRWYLRHPLSAMSVMELLAERGIDVSNRTVLRWVQTFGPQLAAEARKHRRPLGRSWYTDEMFFFRGQDKWYLYLAVDEHGQVVDVLLRTTATRHPPRPSSNRRSAAQARRRVRSSRTTISRTSRRSSGPCQRPCTFGAGSIA
jgi:transposase-like protein